MVTHRKVIDRIARARTHVIRLKYGKVSLCVIAPPAITRARPDAIQRISRTSAGVSPDSMIEHAEGGL
jgi:hypothetical protein